ncbi:hypothetical protein ASZ90_011678 [hydrocarbon metagenome]|uniref:Uncharacterized protein n=1 Tax=hydrocarbon metagenome TaxID=938273 RepID=A0A0W8FCM4_9ZZZZ
MLYTQILAELLFKILDLFALSEHAAPQHLSHRLYLFFPHRGLGYGNKISHQDLLVSCSGRYILCSSSPLKRLVTKAHYLSFLEIYGPV